MNVKIFSTIFKNSRLKERNGNNTFNIRINTISKYNIELPLSRFTNIYFDFLHFFQIILIFLIFFLINIFLLQKRPQK